MADNFSLALIVASDGRFEMLPAAQALDTVRAYNSELAQPPQWAKPAEPGTLFGLPIVEI